MRARGVLLEGAHEAAELLVHGRHLAEVGPLRVSGAERLGRRVGRVRVEVVHPQEEGLRRPVGEEGRGAVRGVLRLAFYRARPPVVVVGIEPAGQAEAAGEHEGRDERGGAVARLAQPLREHRVPVRQETRVLADAVTRGVEPRHHRGVGRQGFRRRRVGLLKPAAAHDQGVEGRGGDADGLGPDRIRTGRVERDEQDRGTSLRRRSDGSLGARPFAPAAPGEQHDVRCREQETERLRTSASVGQQRRKSRETRHGRRSSSILPARETRGPQCAGPGARSIIASGARVTPWRRPAGVSTGHRQGEVRRPISGGRSPAARRRGGRTRTPWASPTQSNAQ